VYHIDTLRILSLVVFFLAQLLHFRMDNQSPCQCQWPRGLPLEILESLAIRNRVVFLDHLLGESEDEVHTTLYSIVREEA
jgi:hypothetical protein